MNKEEFIKAVKQLNVDLTEEKLEKLNKFYNLLIEWNKKINLTRIEEEEEVYLKHFYDSLTIAKAVDLSEIKTLCDIGTGAGFPGIVLKIFYPHLEIVLLDSNNKKTKFLTQLIELIELSDVKVVNERSEEYIIGRRESFDLVTSRAVANLQTLSELSLPFVKLGGLFIPLKGATTSELKASEYAIIKLGGKIDKIITFLLPIENSKRTLIKVKKIMITKTEYPRSFDKILKKPLENN